VPLPLREFSAKYPEKKGPPAGLRDWPEYAENDTEPEVRFGDELPEA